MKVISCFAGLGGAELALKRAGIEAEIYAYEIDKYAEAVNRYNNPDSIFLGDITKWKEPLQFLMIILNTASLQMAVLKR